MNVKNLNIWKEQDNSKSNQEGFLNTEITELNLSVRSYHCLKRAECNTIGDVYACMGEDGQGLRRIRNLGMRSEAEIIERINEYKAQCEVRGNVTEQKKVTIIKPAKKMWDRGIDEFHLSNYALNKLKDCGVHKVSDLYATNPKCEPGWYAVRELFEKIPSSR